MAQLNYTTVLFWHNGKLHTCALMAQYCAQNHRYLAGLLMMRPYLVWTGVACSILSWYILQVLFMNFFVFTERLCQHWNSLVCRLHWWKWSVPWRQWWWWWSACRWCLRLPSQVYTGLLVSRCSWVRLPASLCGLERIKTAPDFWWQRLSGLHADGWIHFRCHQSWRCWPCRCLYQEGTWSALQSLFSDLGQFCIWHLPWWLDVADMGLNFLMGLLSVVDTGLRDRVSATNMSFLGTCLALTLKPMRCINILWQRSGVDVSDKSLVFIRGTSGLWSVTTENMLSPMK